MFAQWANRNYPLSMTGAVGLSYTMDKGYDVVPLVVSPVGSWTELETTDFEGEVRCLIRKQGKSINSYLWCLP